MGPKRMPRRRAGSPVESVAYREMLRLASTGQPLALGAAVEAVQRARVELGLEPYRGGRASDLVQKFTVGYRLHEASSRPPLFRKDGRLLIPIAPDWHRDWRLLFAPRHGVVRALARDGLMLDADAARVARRNCDGTWRFVPPEPVLPEVDVVHGQGDDIRRSMQAFEAARQRESRLAQGTPGVYFFGRGGVLYIGKTEEILTRERGHRRSGALDWLILVARCADEGPMGGDVLGCAEALLISFWSELESLANASGGRDTAPANLQTLREAAAFATVAAAVVHEVTARHSR